MVDKNIGTLITEPEKIVNEYTLKNYLIKIQQRRNKWTRKYHI